MIDTPADTPTTAAAAQPMPDLRERVIDAIKTVFDPEIPINIYELGLIYEVRVEDQTKVFITMTLTTPNCPSAQSLPRAVSYTHLTLPTNREV